MGWEQGQGGIGGGAGSREGIFAIQGNLGGEANEDFQDREQFIGLVVGPEEFLLSITAVHEIIMLCPITWVPNASEFIDGVINLRGTILPAINMRKLMNCPRGQASPSTRIVIVRLGALAFGLIVDSITYVAALLPSEIEAQTLPGKGTGAEFIGSIAKQGTRILGILDLARVAKAAAQRDLDGDAGEKAA